MTQPHTTQCNPSPERTPRRSVWTTSGLQEWDARFWNRHRHLVQRDLAYLEEYEGRRSIRIVDVHGRVFLGFRLGILPVSGTRKATTSPLSLSLFLPLLFSLFGFLCFVRLSPPSLVALKFLYPT